MLCFEKGVFRPTLDRQQRNGVAALEASHSGERFMKRSLIAAAVLAMGIGSPTWGQDAELAAQGQGPLPGPAQTPATLEGAPPAHPFELDASGTLSRILFESNEDPNFKVVIRDVSVLPGQQVQMLNLNATALVQLRGGAAEVTIANQKGEPTGGARLMAPAGTPIGVINRSASDSVIRIYSFEAKQP